MFAADAELAYLQEKMEYRTPSDLYPHQKPHNRDREWNAELLKIGGVDPLGDQRMRIIWAGTEKKRGYVWKNGKPAEGLVIKYPAAIPFIQKIVGYEYTNLGGKVVRVVNKDDVPRYVLVAQPVVEYVQLGELRWAFEMKFTPEELIAMGHYHAPGSEAERRWLNHRTPNGSRYRTGMDRRGEYVKMYRLKTLPEEKYFEPTADWFEGLRAAAYETRNATEADKQKFLNVKLEGWDKAENAEAAAKDEFEDTMVEDSIIEIQKAPQERVYFQ